LQNRCHTFLDCCHVWKTCAFHNALQAGKPKEARPLYSPDLAPAGSISGEYGGWTSLNLFVTSVLFVFLYQSPNFLDTPRRQCTYSVTLRRVRVTVVRHT
jgi:hypothetical protein